MSKRVISFHYTLTNPSGEKLDSSEGSSPLSFIEDTGHLIRGLETELQKLKVGDKKRVAVKAKDAYGIRDEKKVVEVARNKMPNQQLKLGDKFRGGKDDHSPILTVTKLTDSSVTLDGNHELAGVDLTFDVEITGIRDATKEELSHGHVHGPGGHHH